MSQSTLPQIDSLLAQSELPQSSPSIYYLWATIVAAGALVQHYLPMWLTHYWITASAAGFLLSLALGQRAASALGQINLAKQSRDSAHFGVLLIFIITALITSSASAILLIVGLGYALAGLHLARPLFLVAITIVVLHVLTHLGVIQSDLITGLILSASLAYTGWLFAKQATQQPPN